MESTLTRLSIALLPALLAISIHEAAHAWAADRLGDPTARMLGRLTINPLRHLDPIGTIFLLMTIAYGFGIGWAKPVPISVRNLRRPRRDMMWVALAGPGSNLLLAAGSAVVYHLLRGVVEGGALGSSQGLLWPIFLMVRYSVTINVVLAVFNMLPIPPLDGGRVVNGLLPRQLAYSYSQIERVGFYIVIFLMITGALRAIILPAAQAVFQVLL